MIEVNGLTKRYGDRTAINDVTFRVEKGEILAFLGPNGAGKTTTMRILTGFLPATSGTARVAGFDTFEQPMEVKRNIGYLPETPPVYNEMTVREYLNFVGKIKGVSASDQPKALDRVLDRCGLTQVPKRLIGNLSRGYRQRVGLAQALIHNPKVLILDEPTLGLDPKQIIEIRSLIQEFSGEHTVILSTHILQEATALCQRVIIIHEGRIRAVDSPDQLSAKLRQSEKVTVTVRQAPPEADRILGGLPNVLHVYREPVSNRQTFIVETQLGRDIRDDIAQCVVGNGWGLLELKNLSMTLEDVFLKLTQEDTPKGKPQ
jgi:ABC-2 type transport system ATP-binding protein